MNKLFTNFDSSTKEKGIKKIKIEIAWNRLIYLKYN